MTTATTTPTDTKAPPRQVDKMLDGMRNYLASSGGTHTILSLIQEVWQRKDATQADALKVAGYMRKDPRFQVCDLEGRYAVRLEGEETASATPTAAAAPVLSVADHLAKSATFTPEQAAEIKNPTPTPEQAKASEATKDGLRKAKDAIDATALDIAKGVAADVVVASVAAGEISAEQGMKALANVSRDLEEIAAGDAKPAAAAAPVEAKGSETIATATTPGGAPQVVTPAQQATAAVPPDAKPANPVTTARSEADQLRDELAKMRAENQALRTENEARQAYQIKMRKAADKVKLCEGEVEACKNEVKAAQGRLGEAQDKLTALSYGDAQQTHEALRPTEPAKTAATASPAATSPSPAKPADKPKTDKPAKENKPKDATPATTKTTAATAQFSYAIKSDQFVSDHGLTQKALRAIMVEEITGGEKATQVGAASVVEIRGVPVLIREASDDGRRFFAQVIMDPGTWSGSQAETYGPAIEGADANKEAQGKRLAGGPDCGRVIKYGKKTGVLAPQVFGYVLTFAEPDQKATPAAGVTMVATMGADGAVEQEIVANKPATPKGEEDLLAKPERPAAAHVATQPPAKGDGIMHKQLGAGVVVHPAAAKAEAEPTKVIAAGAAAFTPNAQPEGVKIETASMPAEDDEPKFT